MTSSSPTSRIIALVDMDCFYVQVEERDNPKLKGTPAAVVQYNNYKNGGIIAVNYEARARGVTRPMRGSEAISACPEITLVRVPENRGKADLTKYRDAGKEVIQVLCEMVNCVERASVDEAYLDLTDMVESRIATLRAELETLDSTNSKSIVDLLSKKEFETNYVMGHDSTQHWFESLRHESESSSDEIRLAVGAEIIGKVREAVFQKTSFRCSAGVSHNKVLAKICCGLNKPNKQTVLPFNAVQSLWEKTNLKKVRNLGGKLGDYLVEILNCNIMSDLLKFTEEELSAHFGSKTGNWLYNLARGVENEPVQSRQLPKSIGCSKNFRGPEALTTEFRTKLWVNLLAEEVFERLEKDAESYKRRAKTLTVHVCFDTIPNGVSKSTKINSYNLERISADACQLIEQLYKKIGLVPVISLGLHATNFEDEIEAAGCAKISSYFNTIDKPADESLGSTSSKSFEQAFKAAKVLRSTKDPEATYKAFETVPEKTSSLKERTTATCQTLTKVSSNLPSCSSSIGESDENLELPSSSTTTTTTIPQKVFKNAAPTATKTVEECERCGRKVLLKEYVSHMDAHYARDLSREINGLPPLGFDLRPETLEAKEREREREERERRALTSPRKGRGSKRTRGGRHTTSGNSKKTKTTSPSKIPASKTIDSYFKKPD